MSVCGEWEVTIPRLAKVHRVIALGIANSPVRLTGEQLRFLRKYLGYSGEEFSKYLHTDKTKITKWERGEDPLGPATDRLVRLLVPALTQDLSADIPSIAAHLREISDDTEKNWELHIDVEHLTYSFCSVMLAA